MADATEIWRAIPDVPYAEVSNFGRVRTLDRYVPNNGGLQFVRGTLLVPCATGKRRNYLAVRLNGTTRKVHRMVAAAFLGKSELQVNHKSGDTTDNSVENLEYVTGQENVRHAWKSGLNSPVQGSAHGCARLGEPQVLEIVSLLGKVSQRVIAKQFGVSQSTITHIATGRLWGHLTGLSCTHS